MNPYQGGYIDPSVPANQVASVPTGWIDIPGCYLGPPEYYSGNCQASGDPMASAFAALSRGPSAAPALPPLPVLTTENILPPMPDITLATMPTALPVSCSQWSQVNAWIAAHPVLAVAILAGLALVGWPKR